MMLPSTLLPVIVREGKIKPRYMYPTHKNLALLGELISLFKSARGCKRGELESLFQEYESGLEFKTVRCVNTLLLRRCEFVAKYAVDPVEARRVVFKEASQSGVTTREERINVIKRCAEVFHVTPDELEASLWADLEEEQVLTSFKDIEPMDLLRLFNLSLAQTLLFKARGMDVILPAIDMNIIDRLKNLGLMYSGEKTGSLFKLHIEGPLSAVRHCERYGVLMARVLPEVVRTPVWEVHAQIVWKSETPLEFRMSSQEDGKLIRYLPDDEIPAEETIEKEWLVSRLKEGLSEWEIIVQPEPVIIRDAVFHPDLMLKKGSRQVYLELMGFWTEDFIRKRSRLWAQGEGVTYIPVANPSLRRSQKDSGSEGIILFDRRAVVRDILSVIRKVEESEPCASSVKPEHDSSREEFLLPVTGDILDIKALARQYHVSEEDIIRSLEPRGYLQVEGFLISKKVAERITSELIAHREYLHAVKVITDAGIPCPDEFLRRIGFTVIWHGLDPEKAEVRFIG